MKPTWKYVAKLPMPMKTFIQWICNRQGHTVGDTDYSANGLWANCKWCNYYFKIPIQEMPSKKYLKDIFEGK